MLNACHLDITLHAIAYLVTLDHAQIAARSTFAGPNTLVGLAKKEGIKSTELVKRLLPAYSQVLKELKSLGVTEVQIHEPILTIPDAASLQSDFEATFAEFEKSGLFINLVTYYDDIGAAYPWTVK